MSTISVPNQKGYETACANSRREFSCLQGRVGQRINSTRERQVPAQILRKAKGTLTREDSDCGQGDTATSSDAEIAGVKIKTGAKGSVVLREQKSVAGIENYRKAPNGGEVGSRYAATRSCSAEVISTRTGRTDVNNDIGYCDGSGLPG
jgi:hypothetical protein